MQTISINFIVPQGWLELSDKQLRYVYQLLTQNFTSDEVKTLCLLHWTGTKVIGKQNTDGYLLRKGKFLFEVTPLTLAELLPNLDWLGALPPTPIRPVKLKHRHLPLRPLRQRYDTARRRHKPPVRDARRC